MLSLYRKNSLKISFSLKHQINSSNHLQLNDKLTISQEDREKIKKLKHVVDEQHSAYLRNINNYDTKENHTENKNVNLSSTEK